MRYRPGTFPAPRPGHDSYRISRRMASHPRNPGGRDLAEVALSGPPMTHPDTIRPHQGPKNGTLFFFESYKLSCEPRYGIEP